MIKKDFIGRSVDLEYAKEYYSYDEFSMDMPFLEKFLGDFDCDGFTDKRGFTHYSVQIFLVGSKIVDVLRIGHCHMCGGQGSDDELRVFPHRSLEDEAEIVIENVLE